MEAGYDYLLLRSQVQQRFIRASAIFLVITGAVLLTAGIVYFVYAHQARSDLGNLNFALAAPQAEAETFIVPAQQEPTVQRGTQITSTLPPSPLESGSPVGELPQPAGVSPVPTFNLPVNIAPALPKVEGNTQPSRPAPVENAAPQISSSAIASQQPYPGEAIKATYWSDPLEYEPESYVEASLIQGFRPLGPTQAALPGTLRPPTRIVLPSIGVDSVVSGLQIRDLGDSRAYETPKHVVGHIPESGNPGEVGSVWLFGHLESPIAGEGNVFYNLPKIPDLLRKGQNVYTIVENGTRSYLYRMTEAFVVGQDELKLNYGDLKELKPQYAQLDPGGANIHLVVCVPRFVYDSRLVVSGELVGIR